jgi:hypothetical protein
MGTVTVSQVLLAARRAVATADKWGLPPRFYDLTDALWDGAGRDWESYLAASEALDAQMPGHHVERWADTQKREAVLKVLDRALARAKQQEAA